MARGQVVITILATIISVACIFPGGNAATFTFNNHCSSTVWVGTQPNPNMALLASGGFALGAGAQNAFDAPTGWAGRFWGRTGCNFDSSGLGTCETGDCGGKLECNGAGGNPPASLAEFTLNGSNGDDFYDVSLVDGYNLPIQIQPLGGSGTCNSPGQCTSDLNTQCPQALQVTNSAGTVIACKSACEAFKTDEYCCTGAHNTAATCPPNDYSKIFKAACPTSYSYAFDDLTGTFTCKGATYTITFCR